jgi:CPA2 family monovalent cation:H+ antiporter-2
VEQLQYIQQALILLISAIFVVTMVRQLKVSSVLGYLIAGVLIGPFALGFFNEVKSTSALAELGVVFLMFTIGLSMPLDRLKSISKYVFGLGGAQVLLTTGVITLIVMNLGFEFEQALVIGGCLAFSSTAVVMQLLSETGEIAARFGRVSFAVLLFQDLAVVAFMIMLPLLASKQASFLEVLLPTIVKAVLLLVTIVLVGRVLLRPVFKVVVASQTPELFTGMAILVVFITALATAKMGFSPEMGAFVAGTLLAGSEYRHQVEADIEPFRGLLLGLFFMTVGMSIDLALVGKHIWQILSIVGSLLVGKGLIFLILGPMFGLNVRSAFRMAFLLAAGGEFVFILMPTAVHMGLIPPVTSQIVSSAVAISMALTPLLSLLGKYLAERIEPEFGMDLDSALNETKDLTDHVIIGGYGRVGQIIAKILAENLVPFVVLDMNMARVTDGRSKGLPVFFGDIRRLEVMRAVGALRAKVALVSVDHPNSSVRTVHMLRRNFPNVAVCVRARDAEQGEKLEQAGAVVVVPDMIEPTLKAAASVLEAFGTPREEVDQIIDTYRHLHRA